MGLVADWEDDLIPFEKWKDYYDEMPDECKKIVDNPEGCVGVGRNPELGWFVAFSGQGPCIAWSEKKINENDRNKFC